MNDTWWRSKINTIVFFFGFGVGFRAEIHFLQFCLKNGIGGPEIYVFKIKMENFAIFPNIIILFSEIKKIIILNK
jgi:hypothetical protein